MTFPSNIERWRDLVRAQLAAVLASQPSRKSLTNALGLTITPQVEEIILAIIQKESWGDPGAVGDNGNSVGLMQLNYAAGTPQGEGFTGTKYELTDPATNIYYGIKYFLHQLAIYQSVDKAILAYNAGSYRIDAAGEPINASYLESVLSYLTEKKTLFSRSGSSQVLPGGSPAVAGSAPADPGAPADRPEVTPVTKAPAAAARSRVTETLTLAALFAALVSALLFISNC